MKLVRYGPAGKEKPGLIDADGSLREPDAIAVTHDGERAFEPAHPG